MHKNKERASGFTLVEVLIVVVIVGILASIILINIDISRGRAKDAAIASMTNSLMKAALVARDANTGIFPVTWRGISIDANSPASCGGTRFGGDTSAQATCLELLHTAGNASGDANWDLWQDSFSSTANRLSIMVRLPGSGKIYCAGSEGGTSVTTNSNGTGCGTGPWQCPGCPADPSQQ